MSRRHMAILFAFALVVRLIFAAQWHALPYGPDPILDAKIYHQWAQEIAQGHLAHGRAFYMMPLYPYTLGLLYAFFGHSLWVASIFGALIDAATCVVIAELTFAAFGLHAAVMGGILAALYRPFIFYSPMVMKESLGLFLLALFALFACRALKTGERKEILRSGLALGLGALVRGNVLALALVVFGFIFFRNKATRVKNSLFFAVGLAAVILPVTLHNAVASHDFVLTSYAGGFNAYIGHGPMATGNTYEFPPEVSSNPGEEEQNAMRIASKALGRPAKPSEVSTYWRDRAMDYALAHPEHEWTLLMNKIEAFWSNDEPYDNYDMNFIMRHFGTLLSLPLADFGLVFAMALFAIIALQGKQRKEAGFFVAMIGVYMLTLLPFYVTDRYRLSVVVFLLPLAGAAVPAALECYRMRKRERLIVAAVVASVPLALMLMPREVSADDESFAWGQLCTVYEDNGAHVAAVIALNKAVVANPHNVGSDAWIKASDALDNLGHRKEAEEQLRKMQPVYMTDATIPYNIGRMAFIDGDYSAALRAFTESAKRAPAYGLAWRGIAAVYEQEGDVFSAGMAVRQGLAENPDDPVLLEIRDKYK